MRASDVRKKSESERGKLISELREKLHAFRFGMAGGQKKNVREARALKKDIARLKTLHRENKSQ